MRPSPNKMLYIFEYLILSIIVKAATESEAHITAENKSISYILRVIIPWLDGFYKSYVIFINYK